MPTVLVVDDSAVDRKLAGALLERSPNIQVIYAENGSVALEMIQAAPPNAVLTDLVMPTFDGLDLVANIITNHPHIPVILMTGEGNEGVAVKALQAGAASYVPKTSLGDLLVETVEHVLEVAREEQSHMRLMTCMQRYDCSFTLDNDFAMIPPLVNFLHRSVRSVGVCREQTGIRVSVALEEALNNALFHGNLELSSELREEERSVYMAEVESRRTSKPYCDRKIYVDAIVTTEQAKFVIRDEGPGFDPSTLPDPTDPANLEKPSGRGLLLIQTFMDETSYNATGNEVTMIKKPEPTGG
ncbi:MAG: hypothetical protein CL681_28980 [Blastopirellula sp.]|nr:hypothetical protein [Blastopirellula sp.]